VSKGELTRQKILDHALAMARVVGLEGLSIGALADEVRMSKSGLFAHFKSKEALQLDVLHEAVIRLNDVLTSSTSETKLLL
jgi:AcrR family transcriptional regulator